MLFFFFVGIIDQEQDLGLGPDQDQVHIALEEEDGVLILSPVKKILRRPKQRRRKWPRRQKRINKISKWNEIGFKHSWG